MKALESKNDKFRIGKDTIAFYDLTADKEMFDLLKNRLRGGCRLLYYILGIFSEIMPEKADFPFFVCRAPFRETASEHDWLLS